MFYKNNARATVKLCLVNFKISEILIYKDKVATKYRYKANTFSLLFASKINK